MKPLLARFLRWRKSENLGGNFQPLSRPDGFVPLNISVAGVMYQGNHHTALGSALREEVWLRREPENIHDSNAIKVVTRRGHRLGYIGRQLAVHLAPHMDASEDPIPAVITGLSSDVSGSVVAAEVGFFVPADLFKRMRSDVASFRYYCEQGNSGVLYLLLDCDEATLNEITARLAEANIGHKRYGMCYRQATDGRQYPWYVVLEKDVVQDRVEQFFRDCFGVPPRRDETEAPIEEWIEQFDSENLTLREQNAHLRSRLQSLEKGLRAAQLETAQANKNLALAGRNARAASRAEIERILQILLPEISFLRDSMDVIILETQDYQDVLLTLRSLVSDPLSVKGRRVGSTDGWFDLHFNTGQKDDGRLYFKRAGGRVEVLISFKGSQSKDIEYLQKH